MGEPCEITFYSEQAMGATFNPMEVSNPTALPWFENVKAISMKQDIHPCEFCKGIDVPMSLGKWHQAHGFQRLIHYLSSAYGFTYGPSSLLDIPAMMYLDEPRAYISEFMLAEAPWNIGMPQVTDHIARDDYVPSSTAKGYFRVSKNLLRFMGGITTGKMLLLREKRGLLCHYARSEGPIQLKDFATTLIRLRNLLLAIDDAARWFVGSPTAPRMLAAHPNIVYIKTGASWRAIEALCALNVVFDEIHIVRVDAAVEREHVFVADFIESSMADLSRRLTEHIQHRYGTAVNIFTVEMGWIHIGENVHIRV